MLRLLGIILSILRDESAQLQWNKSFWTLWLSSVSYFRSSYKEVHVRLGDMNDHSPVFEEEEFHVRVSEAALVNTPITKLKVSPLTISDPGPGDTVDCPLPGSRQTPSLSSDTHSNVSFATHKCHSCDSSNGACLCRIWCSSLYEGRARDPLPFLFPFYILKAVCKMVRYQIDGKL